MRIPLPHKGQPLDITYIYTLANAVNKLADDIAVDRFSSFGYNNTLQTTASKLGLDAGVVNVAKGGDPTVVTVTFSVGFSEPPVVVASIRHNPGEVGFKNQLSVSNTTAGSATFSIQFDPINGSCRVNWIAIGIAR